MPEKEANNKSNKKDYKCVKATIREVVKTTKSLSIFSTLKEAKLVYPSELEKITKLVGERVIDAVLHVPVNYELWHKVDTFGRIGVNENCCVEVIVKELKLPKVPPYVAIRKHIPVIIKTTTFDGYNLDLIFFNLPSTYFTRYQAGTKIVCQGNLNIDKYGKYTMSHPHITMRIQQVKGCMAVYKLNQLEDCGTNIDDLKIDNIVPIYSLTEGIKQNQIITLVEKIFNNDRFDFSQLDSFNYLLQNSIQHQPQTQNSIPQNSSFPSTKESLMRLHFPKSISDIRNNSPYIKQLAFLELISFQYALSKARANREIEKGIIIQGTGKLYEKVIQNLPFSLTEDQQNCINEIRADQASDKKMLRLLQGDVGSGKTIVALLSAINTIESGHKVVIMAPTAILAKQHFATISKFCFGLGISAELLIGETKQKARKDILTRMKLGQIDILVGTHTLFQAKVELPQNIGLFVIDEQHNFGVEQRVSLINKCGNADILMMTATPIPRTMVMGLYGDINVSCIKHKPSNRLTIDTRMFSIEEKYNALVAGIKRQIDAGAKVYWICPLVDESEKLDYIDVSTRAKELEAVIDKNKIGILHGKMSQEKKDKIMLDFKNGNIQLLIATTVIEVGIDVPDATIIVIENAEKFGLAQLHQLRGRVGRGAKQSYCFLLYGNKITDIGKSRLEILKNNDNGFEVAEYDLKLRGGGTLLDTKQSGFRTMHFVDFVRDRKLIEFLTKAHIETIDKQVIQPIISMFHRDDGSEKMMSC